LDAKDSGLRTEGANDLAASGLGTAGSQIERPTTNKQLAAAFGPVPAAESYRGTLIDAG
jgi:hypothetical protein